MALPHPCTDLQDAVALLLEGGRRAGNPGNSLVRSEPGPGRPRLQLASALKGSWRERGEHNRMLSFYWKINENEWK